YQAHLLGGAVDYLDALPLKDRPVLMGAAAKRGYLLTLAEEERALEARDVLMSELAANDCWEINTDGGVSLPSLKDQR
ncbi:hypothetical protein, partial [Staphylococcus aureus]|uniref:hypothetical protein n=1 Tax=Staphylococcus aureus TaxID=1280 RepID=UPI000C0FAC31